MGGPRLRTCLARKTGYTAPLLTKEGLGEVPGSASTPLNPPLVRGDAEHVRPTQPSRPRELPGIRTRTPRNSPGPSFLPPGHGYNWRAMVVVDLPIPMRRPSSMTVVLHAAFALIAALAAASWGAHEYRKARATASVRATVVLAPVLGSSVVFSARVIEPPPAVGIATRSVRSQPLVASIVDVRRRHGLVLARIGGLYGP